MLSRRGAASAASLDIPWRFANKTDNAYDAVTNPGGVVLFSSAENALMLDELHEFTQKHVASIPAEAYTYSGASNRDSRFSIAMAAHLNEHLSPVSVAKVEPAHIITASAQTAIHELLGLSLADPGEGILVSRPVYGRFELDFGNTAGLEVVYADLDHDGGGPFAPEVVAAYQRALDASTAKVKALVIVNPHNPLGRTYPVQTLRAIMTFCEKNQIHLISDEIYALSTYAEDEKYKQGFNSVLAIDPTGLINNDRLHVLYGMSKDFAAAGLRLGCLITRNELLRKAVICNMRFHNPSGPSLAIGSAILEDREFVASFAALSRSRLLSARDYTVAVLAEAGVRCEPANAGFFIFIDLSPWLRPPPSSSTRQIRHSELSDGADEDTQAREFALAEKLLAAGVCLHPGEEHAKKPGQFRLVFASQKRESLTVGLKRLVAVLADIESSSA